MNDETLTDRIADGRAYTLDGIGVVQVVPRGGVRWDFPADEPYAFEREPDSRGLTAGDVRNWQGEPAPLAPPTDIVASGPAFSCCATCAITESHRRCSGCPRGTGTSKLIGRIKRCQE